MIHFKAPNLLVHCGEFLQREVELARPTKHSTPKEAAEGALECKAESLILTHVNDDHEVPEEMLAESKKIFNDTIVAHDGLKINL